MSENELFTTIDFTIDQASIERAKRSVNDAHDMILKAADAADFGKQSLACTANAFDGIGNAVTSIVLSWR